MTLYEQMTSAIESFTDTATRLIKNGTPSQGVIGMIDGATYVRDNMTIEAAECVVY